MPILRRKLRSRVSPQAQAPLPPPYSDARPPRQPEQRPGSRIEVRYATLEVVERLVELEEQLLPVRALLERALPVLLSSAGVSTGAVLLFKPDVERLVLVAQQGLSEAGVSVLREIAPGGMTGWEIPLHALLNRKAYIIDNIAEHPFVPRLVPVEKLGQVTNLAMAPLYRGSTPAGMIILIADKGRPLEERHVLSLVLPLSLLAVSIDQERRMGSQVREGEEPPQEPPACRPLEVSHLVEEGHAKAQAEKLQQQAEVALGELESLREQLVEAKAELEAEKRRSAAASTARDRAGQSVEQLEAEVQELRARVKSAEGECSQFRQRLAATETEREGLERQLNLAKDQFSQSRGKLGAVEEELGGKRSALAKALEELDASKCEVESARKKMAEAEAKAKSERASLDAALSQARKEASAKAEAAGRAGEELKTHALARKNAEERLAALEKEIAQAREAESSARNELFNLRNDVRGRDKKVAEQMASLKAQLADRSAETSALGARLEAARKEREGAESRFEAERKEKQEALRQARTEQKGAEERLARELAEKAKQEKELGARKAELDALSARLKAAEEEIRKEREALAAERDNKKDLAARLSAGEGRAHDAVARLKQELSAGLKQRAEIEGCLEDLKAKYGKLSQELAAQREDRERAEKEAAGAEKRIATLAEAVASAEKRHRQAQVSLNDAQAAADAYKRKLEEVTRELALNGDERQAALASAQEELAEQKRRMETVAREVESLRGELGDKNQVREQLEGELRALGDKLAGETSVVQRLRRAYTESEKLRIRTAEELSASESQRKQLEQTNAEQAKRLGTIDAEMTRARRRLAELEERCQVLEQTGSKTQEEGLRWQAALSQLNAALSEARTQLVAKSAEARNLVKSAEAAEQQLRELKAGREEAERQAASERSQREALEAKLKALTSEYESWARQRSGWKIEHEQAPVEIRSWSARKAQISPAPVEQEPGAAGGAARDVEERDRGEITLIDDEGLDTKGLTEALGGVGMQVKSIKRLVEEQPKSAVALVNLLAGRLRPFRTLLALAQKVPEMPAVSYVRDPASNRGFCLGATAVVESTTPGEKIAETVGRLCRNAKRVMTVSGDIDAMIGCKNALMRADYAMSMACDARQGADLLELVRPDVLIVDTQLPERGAARFFDSLRALAGQSSKGLILLVPEAEERDGGLGAEVFGGLQLADEISPTALAEAVVTAETLRRGFSLAASAGGVQELPSSGSRMAG